MAKCGKGCMPECEYFTTGACISPFNCPYKIETGYINSATSIPTYMEQYNGMSDDDIKCLKAEIARLTAENAELRARLDKDGLPVKVGDTLYEPFIDRIREWVVDSIYVFFLGINVNCEPKDDYSWHERFVIRENYNDFESRVYLTREAAEEKLKELQEKGE